MRIGPRRGTLTAVLGLCCSWPALTAEVSFAPQLHALVLRGPIVSSDVEVAMASFDAASEKPSAIYLNSSGGDFYAAITLGNWVRQMELDTFAGILCESACAYLWLAGMHRYANSSIGIHAPYVRTSMFTVDVPAEGLMDAAWYLAKLGYDRALIDAIFVVGKTESNECFPITGPETHYLGIGYQNFAEKPYLDELVRLRSAPRNAAGPDESS